MHHRRCESRRDRWGGSTSPYRFHRSNAPRNGPAPRRSHGIPHPRPASARYRTRRPGRLPSLQGPPRFAGGR
eukprot:4157304-Prymnesium_polylepis.1